MSVAIEEQMYQVPEFARRLGVSTKKGWSMVQQRRVSVHRIGRSVRISEGEVRRILEESLCPAERGA